MDPAVVEVIQGPPGGTLEELHKWLSAVHQAFATLTDNSLTRVAEPLKHALEVIERLQQPNLSEQELATADEELFGYLLQARGLALLTYLEEMNEVRNLVAAEVQRLKPDSPERKKGELLQGAYEKAINGLARAYNGLREGRFEELKTIGPVMEEVRRLAQEAGGS